MEAGKERRLPAKSTIAIVVFSTCLSLLSPIGIRHAHASMRFDDKGRDKEYEILRRKLAKKERMLKQLAPREKEYTFVASQLVRLKSCLYSKDLHADKAYLARLKRTIRDKTLRISLGQLAASLDGTRKVDPMEYEAYTGLTILLEKYLGTLKDTRKEVKWLKERLSSFLPPRERRRFERRIRRLSRRTREEKAAEKRLEKIEQRLAELSSKGKYLSIEERSERIELKREKKKLQQELTFHQSRHAFARLLQKAISDGYLDDYEKEMLFQAERKVSVQRYRLMKLKQLERNRI